MSHPRGRWFGCASWRSLVAACGVLAGVVAVTGVHAAPDLVIVVRHAEKAETPREDPGLSEVGLRRAQALAVALAGAGVQHIVTTQWQRTRDTAAALAAQQGLTPMVVTTRKGVPHLPELLATVRALSGRVLVVGHGNTVNELTAALAATPPLLPLCETSYGHAFVVQPGPVPAWLHLRYGEPDPAPGAGCQ